MVLKRSITFSFRGGVFFAPAPIVGDPQSAADDRRGPLCVRAPKDCALFTLTSTARAPDIPGEIRQTPKLESSTDFTSIFLTPKINFFLSRRQNRLLLRGIFRHRVSGVYSKKLAVVRGFNQFLNHPKSYGLIISTYAHCTYKDVDTHGFAHIHSHGHIFFEWIDFIRFFFPSATAVEIIISFLSFIFRVFWTTLATNPLTCAFIIIFLM